MNIEKLTPELLGLMLDKYVWNIELKNNHNIRYRDDLGFEASYCEVSLDTLIRLMIQFILKHGYEVNVIHSEGWTHIKLKIEREIYYNKGFYTEFEAVLEAAHWAAKEEGLIC